MLFLVNDTDVSAYAVDASMSVIDQIDGRNTARFQLRDTGDGNPTAPAIGQKVQITSDATDSGETTDEAVDASEIDIDVTDVTPFSEGDYVRIDSEIMLITGTSGTSIEVLRGALGTTAATHTITTTIYIITTAYFAGTIDQIETVPLSTDKDSHTYTLECVDWNQLADRFLVLGTFTSETSGDIAESLINDTGLYPQLRTTDTLASTEGLSAVLTTSSGYVAPGVDVVEVTFNYKTLTECLDWLAGLTDYYWNIDLNKRLIFGDFDSTVTAITEANKGTYIR